MDCKNGRLRGAGAQQKAVPLCRAAIGVLAKSCRERTNLAMQRLRYMRQWIRRRRIRRWTQEITLAIILTVAAAVFIMAAVLRGDGGPHAPYATARKPATD